jgi:hypothetical protein
MASRTIELHVTGAADASLRNVLKPYVQGAKDAAAQASKEFAKSQATIMAEAKKAAIAVPKVTSAAHAAIAKGEDSLTAAVEANSQKRVRSTMREWDERLRESKRKRAEDDRDNERSQDKNVREAEAAAKKKQRIRENDRKEGLREVQRIGSESIGNIAGVGRRALSFGSQIAGGMGADLDLSSNIGKAVSTQRTVIDTVNSGMIAKNQTATPADVASAQSAVESAGDSAKISYGKMADALKVYVERTGDLDEGKAMLASMGDIAQATGSDIVDVATAAGSMSKALGDVPDKGKKVAELLRVISQEGAKGSVEIRQLASEMPKIASKAYMFDGPREQMIGQLGALAQFAIVGGAKDAAEAGTSVSSFADNFAKMKGKKQAQLKAEYGIDIASKRNAKGEAMSYKTPEELVLETIGKTGGSPEALAKVFGNVRAGRAEAGLAATYTEAGGGDAGLEAVKKKFEDMSKGMTEAQVKAAADLAKASDASKVEEFNNNLQKIAQELVTSLLPQLEKLAPEFIKLADSLGRLVAWAANNPGEAIALAITASIMKAAIGETISSALKSVITGAGAGAGGPAGAAGGGLFAGGKVGLNAQSVTATIASFSAGYGAGSELASQIEQGRVGAVDANTRIAKSELAGDMQYGSQAEINAALAEAQAQKARLQGRISNAEDMDWSKQLGLGALSMTGIGVLGMAASGELRDQSAALTDRDHLGELKTSLGSLTDTISKLQNMKVTVHVTGVQGQGTAEPSGRTTGVDPP